MEKQLILTLLALAPSGYLAASNANANAHASVAATPSAEADAKSAQTPGQTEQVALIPADILKLLDLLPFQGEATEVNEWLNTNPRVHKNARTRAVGGMSLLDCVIDKTYAFTYTNNSFRRLMKKLFELKATVSETRLAGIYWARYYSDEDLTSQKSEVRQMLDLMLSQKVNIALIEQAIRKTLDEANGSPEWTYAAAKASASLKYLLETPGYAQFLADGAQGAEVYLTQEGLLDRDTVGIIQQYIMVSAAQSNPANAGSAKK